MAFDASEARDAHGEWTSVGGAIKNIAKSLSSKVGVGSGAGTKSLDSKDASRVAAAVEKAKEKNLPTLKGKQPLHAHVAHLAQMHRQEAVKARQKNLDSVASRHRALARSVESLHSSMTSKSQPTSKGSKPNLKDLQLKADIKERQRKRDAANRKITQQNLAMNRKKTSAKAGKTQPGKEKDFFANRSAELDRLEKEKPGALTQEHLGRMKKALAKDKAAARADRRQRTAQITDQSGFASIKDAPETRRKLRAGNTVKVKGFKEPRTIIKRKGEKVTHRDASAPFRARFHPSDRTHPIASVTHVKLSMR